MIIGGDFMVNFKLDKVLESREKTKYWLSKETNIDNNTLAKIYSNEAKQIKKETIDKICKALNCKVEDLIEYKED
jgi:putative transcriptional regulator